MDGTVELISTVGFPIVACGALYYMVNNTMKELRETISQNTIAITKLCERLGVDKDGQE